MTNVLKEGLRPYDFIVDTLIGGLGGILFTGPGKVAANTPGVKTRSVNTAVAESGGLVVPWDPNSADAGTKVLKGIAGYPITGISTEVTVPDSYLAQGPVRIRKAWINYPGAGTAAGDAAFVAAAAALNFSAVE